VILNGDRLWLDHASFHYGSDQNASIFPVFVGSSATRIAITNSLFAHPLGCEEIPSCEQDPGGPVDPHNLNFLIGGSVDQVTFERNYIGLARERNPNISAGQPANSIPGGVPATGTARIELVQNWIHGVAKSNFLSGQQWKIVIDAEDNVFTSSSQTATAMPDRPYDIGTLVPASALNVMQFFMRGNREGTVNSLSAIDGPQENIFAAFGTSIADFPRFIAPTRFAPHPGPPGNSDIVIQLVARGAGATLPMRDALDERVIRLSLDGKGRWIETDESEVGGYPDLTNPKSASSGYRNVTPNGTNVTASGSTGTTFAWSPVCTDFDQAPLARHCHMLTQGAAGVLKIAGNCTSGTFNATGVAPGVYTGTYECADGAAEDPGDIQITVNP
jgi:hypothetical protein